MTFYAAYRKLNIFLLSVGIGPFLQNHSSGQFKCKNRHAIAILTFAIIYLSILIWVCCNDVLAQHTSGLSLAETLKLSHTLAKILGFLCIVLISLVNRKRHAELFNALHTFDRLLLRSHDRAVPYDRVNRSYWFECFAYACYFVAMHEIRVRLWDRPTTISLLVFGYCAIAEVIFFGWTVFHMKNCVTNLLLRYEIVHEILETFFLPSTTLPEELLVDCKLCNRLV